MKTVIKYNNRKLYDKDNSKYIVFKDLMALPLGSFKVIEKETGADVTIETLFSFLATTTYQPEHAQKQIDVMKHCIQVLSV